jgi:hypothetical protein
VNDPRRIRLSRAKGWRLPPGAMKVDRSTPWGNPFVVGRDGTRADCVSLFEHMCCGAMTISKGADLADAQRAYIEYAARNRHQLVGKHLACWCPLNEPCHADVLLMVANPEQPRPATLPAYQPLRRVG